MLTEEAGFEKKRKIQIEVYSKTKGESSASQKEGPIDASDRDSDIAVLERGTRR